LTTRKITLKNPPLDIPGANFWEKSGNNKTPPRSGGNFFGNNKTPPRSGGKFWNNKTPPRSGGKILSFFKAKTVKFCNKHTDLWTTINPRRRRGKFLKTTKTRREAADFFWKQQDPGQKIRPTIPYGGVLNVISPVVFLRNPPYLSRIFNNGGFLNFNTP